MKAAELQGKPGDSRQALREGGAKDHALPLVLQSRAYWVLVEEFTLPSLTSTLNSYGSLKGTLKGPFKGTRTPFLHST